MTTVSTQTKPSIGTIWRNGLIAVAVATVIHAVLFFIGSAMGGFPTSVLTSMGDSGSGAGGVAGGVGRDEVNLFTMLT